MREGRSSGQDDRCLAVGNCFFSTPISATMTWATVAATTGIVSSGGTAFATNGSGELATSWGILAFILGTAGSTCSYWSSDSLRIHRCATGWAAAPEACFDGARVDGQGVEPWLFATCLFAPTGAMPRTRLCLSRSRAAGFFLYVRAGDAPPVHHYDECFRRLSRRFRRLSSRSMASRTSAARLVASASAR